METKKRIRVLEVISVLGYGGSERIALQLADGLNRDQFEVSVLGLFGDGPLSQELNKRKIESHFFPSKGRNRLAIQWKLYHFLRERRIDILHVHGAFLLTRILIPSLMAGAKIVHTEHAKFSLQTLPRLRWMARYCFKMCRQITVVSYDLKKYLINELKCHDHKIQVIHTGVDLASFGKDSGKAYLENALGKKVPEDQITVCTVGRLEEAKDHEGLLKAWSMLSDGRLVLLVVGDGRLREKLEETAQRLNVSGRVMFLGGRGDVAEILSASDIFVLPSKREGFPLALIEAMASGRACIATSVGGIPEVLSDGVNGVMIPPSDPAQLAEAIRALAHDPAKRRTLGDAARRTVENEYGFQKMIKEYEQVFVNTAGEIN